jgi:lysophospholipase L1-like esterase
MVGPPPVTDSPARNEAVALLSGRIQEICGRLGVPFFSTAPFARANYATWRAEAERGDGIHPNVASYAALADAIRGWDAWRAWFETGGRSGAASEMT